MSPDIIERFDDYSGIISAGGGYSDISKVDRNRLIELLQRLPEGPVIVSTTQGEHGGVLVKHSTVMEPHWHCLAPIIEIEEEVNVPKKTGPIKLNPKRL